LPLRDFVDGVDVIDALASLQISLMYRVGADAAASFWLRLAPFADGHLHGTCLGVVPALAVRPTLP
jgi:hypothetical protein